MCEACKRKDRFLDEFLAELVGWRGAVDSSSNKNRTDKFSPYKAGAVRIMTNSGRVSDELIDKNYRSEKNVS